MVEIPLCCLFRHASMQRDAGNSILLFLHINHTRKLACKIYRPIKASKVYNVTLFYVKTDNQRFKNTNIVPVLCECICLHFWFIFTLKKRKRFKIVTIFNDTHVYRRIPSPSQTLGYLLCMGYTTDTLFRKREFAKQSICSVSATDLKNKVSKTEFRKL